MNRLVISVCLLLLAVSPFMNAQNVKDPTTFGAYFWGRKALNPGSAPVDSGNIEIERLGPTSIRILLHKASDIMYGIPACSPQTDLKSLALQPRYWKILTNPQYRVIMFTVRDFIGYSDCTTYKDPDFLHPNFYTPQRISNMEAQYEDLARLLADSLPDKTFIFGNWEGDNLVYNKDICNNQDTCYRRRAEGFKKYIQLRTRGVRNSGAKNVFSAIEFNGSSDKANSLMREVIPYVDCDYFSFSSWWAIQYIKSNDNKRFRQELHEIRIALHLAGQDSMKLILGEFGYLRNNTPGDDTLKIGQMMEAIEDLKIPYSYLWVVHDSIGGEAQKTEYGLYLTDMSLSNSGKMFCRFWNGRLCSSGVDPALTRVEHPNGNYLTGSIQPQLMLYNEGPTILDSVNIFYSIDGGPAKGSTWRGSLLSGDSILINLPNIIVANGAHNFAAVVGNPNGLSDADERNNSVFSQFTVTNVASDAGIIKVVLNYQDPRGCVAEIKPKVTLKNFGTTVINNVEVRYRLDNGTVSTRSWSGTLNPGNTKEIILPAMTLGAGQHELLVYTTRPNGVTDVKTSNDTTRRTFTTTINDPGVSDIGVVKINYPGKSVCNSTIKPRVTLKNFGTDTLYSAVIEYGFDLQNMETFIWSGTLLPNKIIWALQLPSVSGSYGLHQFYVITKKPNQCVDVDPSNDTSVVSVTLLNAQPTDIDFVGLPFPKDTTYTKLFTPRIAIKNLGPAGLDSVRILYGYVGQPFQMQSWNGNLASGQTDVFNLGSVPTEVGLNPFRAYITSPNGCKDIIVLNDTTEKNVFGAVNDVEVVIANAQADTCTEITPKLTLRNKGNIEVLSVDLKYTVNGGTEHVRKVSAPKGSGLAPGNTMELAMASSPITAGTHQLKLYTSQPNGEIDWDESNDTLQTSITVVCDVGITENIESEINIYPNPTSGIFFTRADRTTILDLTGKVLFSTGKKSIDLSPYPAGIYFVRSELNGGFYTLKLLKKE